MNTGLLIFSGIVIAFSLVAVLAFERTKTTPSELMLMVVFTAAAVLSRIAFAMLPGIKPCTALIVMAGFCLGPKRGYMVGALTALISNMYFSQGPWTVFQIFAWGLCGLVAGLCFRRENISSMSKWTILSLVVYSMLAAMVFGVIMDTYYVIGFIATKASVKGIITAYLAGFTFNLTHVLSTGVFMSILCLPIFKMHSRYVQTINSISSKMS